MRRKAIKNLPGYNGVSWRAVDTMFIKEEIARKINRAKRQKKSKDAGLEKDPHPFLVGVSPKSGRDPSPPNPARF